MTRSPLLPIVLVALLTRLPAQADPAPAAPGDAAPAVTAPIRYDATTIILPAGTMGLRDLVAATANFLDINILRDEQDFEALPQTVSLQHTLRLDRVQAEDIVSDILFAKGFVLAPRDLQKGLYDLIWVNGRRVMELAQLAVQRTPAEILKRPMLEQPVITICRLQTINASHACNALRPFFGGANRSPTALTLGTAGDNQSLLLTGMQSEVARALQLLAQADDPPPQPAAQQAEAAVVERLAKTIADLERRVHELEQQLARQRQAGGD